LQVLNIDVKAENAPGWSTIVDTQAPPESKIDALADAVMSARSVDDLPGVISDMIRELGPKKTVDEVFDTEDSSDEFGTVMLRAVQCLIERVAIARADAEFPVFWLSSGAPSQGLSLWIDSVLDKQAGSRRVIQPQKSADGSEAIPGHSDECPRRDEVVGHFAEIVDALERAVVDGFRVQGRHSNLVFVGVRRL
jgi:hypothetical protein